MSHHSCAGLIKSIDVNETDEYGYTGLHLAAEHGHMKVVEELMVNNWIQYLFDYQIFFMKRLQEQSWILWCLTATIFQCILQLIRLEMLSHHKTEYIK